MKNLTFENIRTEEFKLRKIGLDYHQLILGGTFPDEDPENSNLFEIGGKLLTAYSQNTDYHPTRLIQIIILNGILYNRIKDIRCFNTVKKSLEYLFSKAEEYNEVILFPYQFEWRFLNVLKNPNWYSGMAQGQALSALAICYEVEKDERYLKLAQKIFNSLLLIKGESENWVSVVDRNGYFWIEEIPSDSPSHILNGFLFAILGIYDYMNLPITENSREMAKKLLFAALTTIKDHIDLYHTQEHKSFYSLASTQVSMKYHLVHMNQLYILWQITDDITFYKYYCLFRKAIQ